MVADTLVAPLAHLSPPPIKGHHVVAEGPFLLPFSPTLRNAAAAPHRRLAVDFAHHFLIAHA
jgi:hypothetical protein